MSWIRAVAIAYPVAMGGSRGDVVDPRGGDWGIRRRWVVCDLVLVESNAIRRGAHATRRNTRSLCHASTAAFGRDRESGTCRSCWPS
jgi:hypothetical protein